MQTLADIKRLLDERGLRPKHALGQNFLIDHNLLNKLVDAARVAQGDLVLEIGPGTGTLTETLLARGCRVVACELDDNLADLLRDRIPSLGFGDRFRLVHGDCLAKSPAGGKTLNTEAARALADSPFTLVSNLPYGAGTTLILALLIDYPRCARMAVTIQKEVAERLRAAPGSKDYGLISVVAQAMADVHSIATLPPACFWPRPDVTSAMVLVERREHPLTSNPRGLAALCQRLFSKRRKQLGAILGKLHPLPPGITSTQRPEELSPAQFVALLELADTPSTTK